MEPSTEPGHTRIRAHIAGLHCSLCTGTIEKTLSRKDGVGTVAVSLSHEQALVDFDPDRVAADEIASTLRDIGYELHDPRKLRPYAEQEADLVAEGKRLLLAIAASLTAIGLITEASGLWGLLAPASVVAVMVPVGFAIMRRAGNLRAALGAVAMVAPAVAAMGTRAGGLLPPPITGWVAAVLAVGVVIGVGPHILRMAYQSARRGILNQHVLLEVGAFAGIAGGAIGLSGALDPFPTAAFFAVSVLIANYHIFSEWLSLLVKTRSSQAVKKLLDLQPDLARVVRDGVEAEVPLEQVTAGDLVRVRPGEAIPVDGTVYSGHSAVDLSLVTGEPVPAERSAGDEVVGGSLNDSGTLLIEVTAVGAESFLSQIVRHVEDARALKPGILHLVDRILRFYTPTVLSISALALLAWLGGSWALTDTVNVQRAVFAALSVLVMGYPCAVGIAAPLAIVRGSGDAADQGIIMRTGEAFQTFRMVTQVLLDKTGTLTRGQPAVTAMHPAAYADLDDAGGLGDPDEVLAAAAAAESSSEHPLARAIVDAATGKGLHLPEAEDFQAVTGFGVRARADGADILVGRPAFLTDEGADLTALADTITDLEGAGNTVVAVARDQRLLGVIALGDQPRPEAAEAVTRLRRAGITPVLVTGDNQRTATAVAAEVGIDEIHAGVRPDGKAELLRDLQADGTRVGMVGDGINDAPALMQADVGIAMGGGTDIAVEAADIIIVGDDLTLVPTARDTSARAYNRTRANVAIAFTFNGIGVPLATTGLVYPVWAMIAMAASVTGIFLNSIGERPSLLFAAIASVGRPAEENH